MDWLFPSPLRKDSAFMCFVYELLFEYSKALFSHKRLSKQNKTFFKRALCGVVLPVPTAAQDRAKEGEHCQAMLYPVLASGASRALANSTWHYMCTSCHNSCALSMTT